MADQQTSIWKKEITLRLKQKDAAGEKPSKADRDALKRAEAVRKAAEKDEAKAARAAEKAARKQQVAAPAAEKTSFWKKEIGLPKRSSAAPAPVQPALPAAAVRPPAPAPLPVSVPRPSESAPAAVEPREEAPVVAVPELVHDELEAPALSPEAPTEVPAPRLALPPGPEPAPAVEVDAPVEQAPVQAPAAPAAATPAERRRRRPALRRGRGRHRAKKIVGIKIGASQLAAARVSNNGSIELQQLAREPLESGVVVAGELRDPDALAEALKKFFKKHKLPKRGIRLGIANNRVGVRAFEIEGVENADQLRNAVRFRAQDALPIPVDEAVLDYHVVGEGVDADGAPATRVVLVVAYRDLIDRYVLAFRKAGLRLAGVDLEAFALLRSLGAPPGDAAPAGERTGVVVVSVGHDRSTFAVSDGRICEFTRVLDWGGSSLDVAIARAVDVLPAEAVSVKLQLSLADDSIVPAELTPDQAEAARDAVRRSLEAFARDLVSSLRFYQSQPDSLAIRELILSGGTANLPGLAAELERLLDVRVRIGDPLARVKVGRRLKQPENLGSLAAAIGLGIED
jgi:type IV pilus assembly protein PilM